MLVHIYLYFLGFESAFIGLGGEKMKECPNCHQQIADNASFYPKCGAKQTTNKLCPRCHAEAAKTAKICTHCGYSFRQEAVQAQTGQATSVMS